MEFFSKAELEMYSNIFSRSALSFDGWRGSTWLHCFETAASSEENKKSDPYCLITRRITRARTRKWDVKRRNVPVSLRSSTGAGSSCTVGDDFSIVVCIDEETESAPEIKSTFRSTRVRYRSDLHLHYARTCLVG